MRILKDLENVVSESIKSVYSEAGVSLEEVTDVKWFYVVVENLGGEQQLLLNVDCVYSDLEWHIRNAVFNSIKDSAFLFKCNDYCLCLSREADPNKVVATFSVGDADWSVCMKNAIEGICKDVRVVNVSSNVVSGR